MSHSGSRRALNCSLAQSALALHDQMVLAGGQALDDSELARMRAAAKDLRRDLRRRKRRSSVCFLLAGVGFGTAFYLLRVRFTTLRAPEKTPAFIALIGLTILLFWLGSRSEVEASRCEERLREIEERSAASLSPRNERR